MRERDLSLLQDYVQNITDENANKLKVVHINAQSLNDTSHHSEFLSTFSDCGIDVICVSETWLKTGEQVYLPGYNSFNVTRNKKVGGGVSIFVRSLYPAKVLAHSCGEMYKPEYLIIDITVGSDKIMFAGIYRPPKVGHLDLFLEDMYKNMVNYKYVFVAGDLNARFGSGADETAVITNMLKLCNLTCVPFESTFHTETCDSNLDVIASNCHDRLISFGQRTAAGFSAHDLIFSVFNLNVASFKKHTITYRNFNKIDQGRLLIDVENMQWLDFFNENDIDQKLTLFNSNVIELMNRHAPLITKNVKNFNAPWMTAEIRSLLSERDKLRDRSKRTKIPIDLENFRKARNKVKQVIRNSKIKYYYDTFARCNDSKTMWSTIKSLRIGKPPTQKVDPVMPVNDLNSHYASVSSVRNSELIDSATSQYSNLPRKFSDINEQFFFGYAMPLDIYKAIQSIKSKATGVDNLSISFLKLCLPALMPIMEHLFNFCLQNSVFPSMWKMANILPIPKNKSPRECKDYRPVSILCVLGKALEKIVHAQVSEFLSERNLFAEFQSGFRKGHSTVTALVKVADDIRKSIDKRLMSMLVLLDLSKAFDCVHHELLLAKLKYLGFSRSAVAWFQSYLVDRCHRVFVSDTVFSDWTTVKTGVPQGSVLGPLLFLIYLFDLPSVINSCSYHMYADDIQLYTHFTLSDHEAALGRITSDILQVIEYCEKHNLVLNVGKTQAIILGTQKYLTLLNKNPVAPLVLNGCTVPYSKSVNNLGVLFDPALNWTEHCISVVQKQCLTLITHRSCLRICQLTTISDFKEHKTRVSDL
ncbi:putative RNA-directed DNA polymerase from transposon BS [Frankliniella fusca]|uniref:RNA-directed DNA polymerase from transposon BS n=1 Tax=Frankliniella fusca TaxID=407009 RepID=A0AAE1H2B6_9NEOP|nr:putative RNA-directed DNA polymerase from transposon BS [Frankliniella fusca]